jgi:catechol 2,3-dioxygenase-like lactoylglutathione lyase family enzyme
MMAGFTIASTNHTSFTVSSLDRAIGLFRDALGFELLNRSPRDPKFIEQVVGVPGADIEVAYLQAPGHRLELIEYLGPDDRSRVESRPCDAGFAHIAFDVDDIDGALAAVREAGSEPLGEPVVVNAGPNKGGMVVYTRDPDGITVEFIQKPKA